MKEYEKVKAMVHSRRAVEEVELAEETDNNNNIVITKDGVKCRAIYNVFNGLFYADDIYGVIPGGAGK